MIWPLALIFKALMSGQSKLNLVKELSNLPTFPAFLMPLLHPPPISQTGQQSETVWPKVFEVKCRQSTAGHGRLCYGYISGEACVAFFSCEKKKCTLKVTEAGLE